MLEPQHIATPVSGRIYLGLALAGLGGLFGAWLAITPATPPERVVKPSALLKPAESPKPIATVAVEPANPKAAELSLVFQVAGVSYVRLDDLGAADDVDAHVAAMPKHGKLKLRHDKQTYITSVVAAVQERDLPEDRRGWIDRRVAVDASCTARVDGFAIVSRLVGDPDYAGLEKREWTAKDVLESGHAVLAARLDGCPEGSLARDAALPPIVMPESIENPQLEAAARSLVINSELGKAAAAAWKQADAEGVWHEQSTFDIQVVRHPTTNATWVSVHAHYSEGCGGANVNVFGLFRATGDKLATVELRELEDMTSVELFDLEGDGNFELMGKRWLFDFAVKRADGAAIDSLEVPFFGCPC